MSKRHVSALLIALVLVVGAIFLLLPGQTAREPSDADQAAVPGLEAAVNDLNRIVAIGAGDTVIATLERVQDGWAVQEFAGYSADLAVLREVLGGLAQARVIEPKTDNPDYYARLGVEDVAAEDAAGLRLDLAADGQAWSIIIGKEAPARSGHYLRLAEAPGSLLVDYTGVVPDAATDWVDTDVIDLLAAEVAEVRVQHADGETLTAYKISADETDFALRELPEGREIKSAWSVNSLGSTLSTLDFEAVRRADELDWASVIAVRALRFDGLDVSAELLRLGDEGDWLRLSASAPVPDSVPTMSPDSAQATNSDSPDAAQAADSTSTDTDTAADPESTEAGEAAGADAASGSDSPPADDASLIAAAMEEVLAEADAINARVGGWAFRIPTFKADAMDQRLVDVLREPGSNAGDGPPAGAGAP